MEKSLQIRSVTLQIVCLQKSNQHTSSFLNLHHCYHDNQSQECYNGCSTWYISQNVTIIWSTSRTTDTNKSGWDTIITLATIVSYLSPIPLQGCNNCIICIAIPLESLSLKLIAPYTNALLS